MLGLRLRAFIASRSSIASGSGQAWLKLYGRRSTRCSGSGCALPGRCRAVRFPSVLSYRPGALQPGPAESERELAARIVTLADIDVAVRTAIAHPGGYTPLAPATRISRLAVKMTAGRCADNSIERAEHLRLEYRRYWRERASGDPAARATQERLHRTLLRISDHAAAMVAQAGSTWGAGLWEELQARIDAMATGMWPDNLDADLRLGGVCELASRCQVWFSARFDVNAEIARLRELGGAAP